MFLALLVAYVFYVFECLWLSSVARDLWVVKDQVTCSALLRTLKQNPPSLHFRVQCYHFENKTVKVKGPDGREMDHTVRKRVNTYSETDKFEYERWTDESDTLIGLNAFGVMRLTLDKSLHYLDRDTEEAVKAAFQDLQDRNRDRDEQMESEMWTAMPGFSEKPPLCFTTDQSPGWMSFTVYLVLSLFVLSWFYRILFETSTGDLKYHVRKSISVKDTIPEHGDVSSHPPITVTGSKTKGAFGVMIGILVCLIGALVVFLLMPKMPNMEAYLELNAHKTGVEVTGKPELAFKTRAKVLLHVDANKNLFKLHIDEIKVYAAKEYKDGKRWKTGLIGDGSLTFEEGSMFVKGRQMSPQKVSASGNWVDIEKSMSSLYVNDGVQAVADECLNTRDPTKGANAFRGIPYHETKLKFAIEVKAHIAVINKHYTFFISDPPRAKTDDRRLICTSPWYIDDVVKKLAPVGDGKPENTDRYPMEGFLKMRETALPWTSGETAESAELLLPSFVNVEGGEVLGQEGEETADPCALRGGCRQRTTPTPVEGETETEVADEEDEESSPEDRVEMEEEEEEEEGEVEGGAVGRVVEFDA
uniref:Uncharacterized protein n=1 Tax=Chromera velia CCMP2878 TaxID=1169474 RepID=A0A0G4I5C0_9ALVE|eukprot:Cvel_11132.t1-p1 / transcript=Cvel_11132.t1 / gene=Cvel_11132 / organism=Chromera_velia_CCMP2878 / gene_product=Transmembrane protein 151B, putative / transcript_product=Transmembrane protein 151B, putative / location=Cvel_scaffold690:11452-17289(+) / protein_length=586 / sequence_SO=supercontig / SO=protein_coding / is_pseudo=false